MMRKRSACQFYGEKSMKQKRESVRLVYEEQDKSPGLNQIFFEQDQLGRRLMRFSVITKIATE